MKQLAAGVNDDGMRLDRFIGKLLPHLPASLIQKFLRQKKVRVNGRHPKASYHVAVGDIVVLFFRPELFEVPARERKYTEMNDPGLNIVYEDNHLLIVNKPAGQSCHDDAYGDKDTLITRIHMYLYRSGAWSPETENSFKPALCHRLDRNTCGLVMAAKTREALVIIAEKLRQREIDKIYECVARGVPQPDAGIYRDYILRHPEQSTVLVLPHPVAGARTAITRYRTLAVNKKKSISMLECKLETGRTHQIRAQLAFHGHPLLGDGKYGKLLPGDPRAQCLCARKLVFSFKTPAGSLEYLKGKSVELEHSLFNEMFKYEPSL